MAREAKTPERQISKARWTDNLVYFVTSRAMRDLVLETGWAIPKEQYLRFTSDQHTYT